jgi:hypothetical protein
MDTIQASKLLPLWAFRISHSSAKFLRYLDLIVLTGYKYIIANAKSLLTGKYSLTIMSLLCLSLAWFLLKQLLRSLITLLRSIYKNSIERTTGQGGGATAAN